MTWRCANCLSDNNDTANFCRNCGTLRPSPKTQMVALGGAGVLPPRTLLLQRYMIMREIARGGQGVVYEAFDQRTCQPVAIKAILLNAIANPQNYAEATARVKQEAQILSLLSHPNIVKVVEQFEENGYPYVVMEYIDGQNLARVVANAGGRLPESQAVSIARQLCAALTCLHTQSPPIIFRDMKPYNIMVDGNHSVKVIDFGIARHYRPGAQTDSQVLGSVGYAAPEQYGGGQTDARSDIYTLGVTLLNLVTGYNPATNSDPSGNLPPACSLNPAVSRELEAVISRATQRNPDERYQSASEFLHALDALPALTTSAPTHNTDNEIECWHCHQMTRSAATFCRHCGARNDRSSQQVTEK